MILASKRIIPEKCWNHQPEMRDINGNTVAMYFAFSGMKDIPK